MEEEPRQKEEDRRAKKWPQYLAAFLDITFLEGILNLWAHDINIMQWTMLLFVTASIPMVCVGSVTSWTAPALHHLQQQSGNDTFSLTDEEASWVGSMMPLGAIFGALPAGFLAELIGRKLSLILLASPFLGGWAMILAADNNFAILCSARLITGFAVGATTVVIPLYNEEHAEVAIRGRLGCFLDFMITVGFLWTYVMNIFLSYFWLSVSCSILPILFFLSFVWMPESPVYLLFKMQEEKAKKSLRFFRGVKYLQNYDIQPEISLMKDYIKEGEMVASATGLKSTRKLEHIKQLFFISKLTSTTPKAMRIVFGLIIVSQITGIQAVIYYTVEILQRGISSIHSNICTAIIAVVQFVVSFSSLYTVDKVGRRFLLLFSATGMTISVSVLTLHFILLGTGRYIENFGWIPCISITIFISSYAVGLANLTWLLMAEIVPTESKGWVSTICVFLSWTFQFLTTKVFNSMITNLGDVETYLIFTVTCILSIVYVKFCVPETKNKTRAEIQNELKKEKFENTRF